MPRVRLPLLASVSFLVVVSALPAADPVTATKPEARTVEQVAASARGSVVVITHAGRDGKRQGLGTGFVVRADGLIATNFHVIGEARPITVETADGKRYDVTAVHASDRALDLAVVRIDARDLPALELGDPGTLKEGQPVVALGNPHGLKHSVVSGVVSGKRDIDGRPMIQVAIPIEAGNSGGPLLDLHGRVHGLLTIKSLVTDNLGFAVSVNSLKPLLQKPNPVPMARWLTIGALDPKEWKAQPGARWRQRAGRIQVEGAGPGFGGRSLCLSQRPVPALPFEVAVTVRLDDEAGAAGLVFHADGGDRHYGFYPSAGQLRLTRFDGPDVFSWKVLHQEPSRHYRPGDWNTLKVRLDKDKVRCFVNGHPVIESTDAELTAGQVGLAKFRDTRAEFKDFRLGKQVPTTAPSAGVLARVSKSIEGLPAQGPPRPELVDALVPEGPAGAAALRERAKTLEQQAAQLRQLAVAVHQKRVVAELVNALQGKEDEIDLLHAALLIAKLDNEELDVDAYRHEVDRFAREVAASLPKGADEKAKLAGLNKYLFTEFGFHGSRADYYNRSNSYLNEVIDDREGLPITLSVLYMELARRLGVKVVGVALPGHFVVKHVPARGEPQLIDVYEAGQPLPKEAAGRKVEALAGRPLKEEDLTVAGKRQIVVRMLHNLLGNARDEKDLEGMLRYVDAVLAVSPDAAQERWLRAVLRYQTDRRQGAREDADWLLEHHPAGIDLERVQELRKLLEQAPQ
jgi:regulator of sirC expression with transglutaminase-like and TPR domain/S1-C subfamily serine protease